MNWRNEMADKDTESKTVFSKMLRQLADDIESADPQTYFVKKWDYECLNLYPGRVNFKLEISGIFLPLKIKSIDSDDKEPCS